MIAINFDNLAKKIYEIKSIMEKGEEIIIEESGHPIAKIIPFHQPKKRILGKEAGKIRMSEDFNTPLPEEWLKEFYK
jgi:antitoxin (DNA-binding transcriptional repressor) of toxin-antitoxin stability system